ncbi:Arginyl-tRNA--protein transferase 1 [Dipsacomyces acuminosporus]|nr:Arginyl-tRNA--protein transferase 1 [Dipsacomyces acuminosporus]
MLPSGSEQDTSDDSSMEDEGLLAAQSSDDEASDSRSHIEILGMQSRAKCGYCGTPDGSRFFAIRSDRLTCQDYQCLVDRGWRRSGSMLYLTDHSDACCAYYTIRTHALEHRLSPSDKKLMRKLRRYFACHADSKVAAGDTGDSEYISKIYSLDADKAGAGAPSSPSPLSLSPPSSSEPSHPKLKVRLESPAFSEAKYALFEKYQIAVHDDHKATRSGFRRFLCDSPLVPQQPQSTQEAKGAGGGPLPRGLGSYHQCYYIDGRLVAVGVLDILPSVSTLSSRDIRGWTLAIDASIFIQRFFRGRSNSSANLLNAKEKRHVYGMYDLAMHMRSLDITPIFIFDGKERIAAKEHELEKRRESRGRAQLEYESECLRARRVRVMEAIRDHLLDLDDDAAIFANSAHNGSGTPSSRLLRSSQGDVPLPLVWASSVHAGGQAGYAQTLQPRPPTTETHKRGNGGGCGQQTPMHMDNRAITKGGQVAGGGGCASPAGAGITQDRDQQVEEAKSWLECLLKHHATAAAPASFCAGKSKDEAEKSLVLGKRTTLDSRLNALEAAVAKVLLFRLGGSVSLDGACMSEYKTLETLRRLSDERLDTLWRRIEPLTEAHLNECKRLVAALGFAQHTAEQGVESESVCAALTRAGVADATCSEDLDVLAFGGHRLLRGLYTPQDEMLLIDAQRARHDLGLSQTQFIDLCILCGTDFASTVEKVGPVSALRLIQKFGSIERILEQDGGKKYRPRGGFTFQAARDYRPRGGFTFQAARDVFAKDAALPFASKAQALGMSQGYSESVLAELLPSLYKQKQGSDPFAHGSPFE